LDTFTATPISLDPIPVIFDSPSEINSFSEEIVLEYEKGMIYEEFYQNFKGANNVK
jgi:hypothetical protein